jgi:hypothetical protein
MQPISTAFSPRLGLAIAAGVTGLVLAGSVTLATLVGWVQPAQSPTASAQSVEPGVISTNLFESGVATPQVVLVPVMPTNATVQSAPPAPSAGLPIGFDGRVPQAGRNETFARPGAQEGMREHGDRIATGRGSDRSPRASAPDGRGRSDDD